MNKLYFGIVESLQDPLKLGRIQVRVYNVHPVDKTKVPTDSLVWSLVVTPTTSPSISGLGHSPFLVNGSTVVGYYIDDAYQDFLILGTISGTQSSSTQIIPSQGFADPEGQYPRALEDPDLNIRSREGDDPDAEFDITRGTYQPYSTYNPQYPHNHVYETTSGHLKEYDDTPGAERIREKHTSGTYYEIQSNGTKVERIQRDNYQLIIGDDTIEVKGSVNVIVSGNANVAVAGNVDAHVQGNITAVGEQNLSASITDKINVTAGNDINITTNKSAHIQASDNINIRADKAMEIYAKDDILIKSDKNIQLKGENIYINE